jgi:uncharacterized protein (TIGR03083 family)
MTDHTPPPGTSPPGTLLLRTAGACDLDPHHLVDVFGEQRHRFTAVLQGFGPGDWAAPTRCAQWSAHDVVRHLCDGTALATDAGPDDRTLDITAGFDPRITPGRRLAASAGESPAATLSRLVAATDDLLARARDRLARGCQFDLHLPYGPMDWTVLLLHTFWDSWIHERDVLLARGAEHATSGDAASYAAAYGVFISAAVASMFGDPVRDNLTLGGDGGGGFDLDGRGTVTLTVSRVTTAGPPATEVTDALAGRAPAAAVLSDLPASTRTALSHLAGFFNTPAPGSQASRGEAVPLAPGPPEPARPAESRATRSAPGGGRRGTRPGRAGSSGWLRGRSRVVTPRAAGKGGSSGDAGPAEPSSGRHPAANPAESGYATEQTTMRLAFHSYWVQAWTADPQRQAQRQAPARALAPAAAPEGNHAMPHAPVAGNAVPFLCPGEPKVPAGRRIAAGRLASRRPTRPVAEGTGAAG